MILHEKVALYNIIRHLHIIDILVSENKQTVDRDKVNVNPHRIYTFYAIGYAPNFDVIQSVDGATFLI